MRAVAPRGRMVANAVTFAPSADSLGSPSDHRARSIFLDVNDTEAGLCDCAGASSAAGGTAPPRAGQDRKLRISIGSTLQGLSNEPSGPRMARRCRREASMKTILRAARCVAGAIALFTAVDVVADDDRHGLNHYILDLIANVPVISPGFVISRLLPHPVPVGRIGNLLQRRRLGSIPGAGQRRHRRKTRQSLRQDAPHERRLDRARVHLSGVFLRSVRALEAHARRHAGIRRPRHSQARFRHPEWISTHEQRLGQAPRGTLVGERQHSLWHASRRRHPCVLPRSVG